MLEFDYTAHWVILDRAKVNHMRRYLSILLLAATLFGVYHVAAQPISKFDLLKLIAEIYGKTIELIPVDQPVCDRSLNQARFSAATGYVAPEWPELIRIMCNYKLVNG